MSSFFKFISIALLLTPSFLCAAESSPVNGISHVTFRVSDLDRAKAFYTGILGFPQCFDLKRKDGTLFLIVLKVNDDQFIEILPNLQPTDDQKMTHIALVTSDVESLYRMLVFRGLQPAPLRPPGGDGTRALELKNPDGRNLEFTQYLPDSQHALSRGQFLDSRRLSTHLLHAGIVVDRARLDQELEFYRDKLGFIDSGHDSTSEKTSSWIDLRVPGSRGDALELMLSDPNPSRSQYGFMQHVCLEVSDIQIAFRTIQARDTAHEQKRKPEPDANGRMHLDLYDPDGSRIELLQTQ